MNKRTHFIKHVYQSLYMRLGDDVDLGESVTVQVQFTQLLKDVAVHVAIKSDKGWKSVQNLWNDEADLSTIRCLADETVEKFARWINA